MTNQQKDKQMFTYNEYKKAKEQFNLAITIILVRDYGWHYNPQNDTLTNPDNQVVPTIFGSIELEDEQVQITTYNEELQFVMEKSKLDHEMYLAYLMLVEG